MFTGLVQRIGEIVELRGSGEGMALRIRHRPQWSDLELGESIAVDGVCLTVTAFSGETFQVDVSPETVSRTKISGRRAGHRVNLERALRLCDRLGGHLVLGHVDGVGRVASVVQSGGFWIISIEAPKHLTKYIASKGSICVDGVSLTVASLEGTLFSLALIPATIGATTLAELRAGDVVNIEVDTVARYVERLMVGEGGLEGDKPTLMDRLMNNGFIR